MNANDEFMEFMFSVCRNVAAILFAMAVAFLMVFNR